jgi:DNA polymerase
MPILYLDLETYSPVPISRGVYAYAEYAEILLFAYAIDDAPARVWDCTSGALPPAELAEALADHSITITAHNAAFDRTVLRVRGYYLPIARWRCTMAKALAHGLPGSLNQLCTILGVPADKAKDMEGRKLVRLFCQPQPATRKIRRATRDTHRAEWERFVEYARLDVEAMREVDRRLPEWNYRGDELALWRLDQEINDRGFLCDVELARAAIRAVERAKKALADRTQELTAGQVTTATQRDALLEHIAAIYGLQLNDLRASTVESLLDDESLPEELRELLAVRLQASSTSVRKYQAVLDAVSKDGRLRGALQFCGASRTGRWAGRVFQPQNLCRPTMPNEEIERGIEALKADCADLITDNVIEIASSALRGVVVAPQGKKLIVADLSNIEGRVLAWLAGERWKVDAFAAFDRGEGHDLYKLAYARAFGIRPEDVTKDQRQIGKVMELALGYEGGVGAFVTFASVYGIDLDAMADQAVKALPDTILQAAKDALAWANENGRASGLSDKAWVACDAIKRAWRAAHPATAAWWRKVHQTVVDVIVDSVFYPGRERAAGRLTIAADADWLRIRLPSGRFLCYREPRIEGEVVSYTGVNQRTRQWSRIQTYGGKLVENITQAVARDVLAAAIPRIEAAGYQIVLTVHDEIVAEAPDEHSYSAEHLAALMATPPSWAEGLPLAAAGFETYRYRKG